MSFFRKDYTDENPSMTIDIPFEEFIPHILFALEREYDIDANSLSVEFVDNDVKIIVEFNPDDEWFEDL